MQRAITNVVSYQPYLPRIAAVLSGVCALSIFLYGTFLLLAVMHTATRTQTERQIATTQAALGDVEAQYLAATRELTPEHAALLGFTTPAEVSVVYASATQRLGQAGQANVLSVRAR